MCPSWQLVTEGLIASMGAEWPCTNLAGIFSSPPGFSVQTGAVQVVCSWGATQSTYKEAMGPVSRSNAYHKEAFPPDQPKSPFC